MTPIERKTRRALAMDRNRDRMHYEADSDGTISQAELALVWNRSQRITGRIRQERQGVATTRARTLADLKHKARLTLEYLYSEAEDDALTASLCRDILAMKGMR
ncbi:hypothetical protein J2D73_19275 [Acetobacter sacchari]|uniref:Uncharacterized protein n=1 Tax=Acetobacter sacchari TaxID=2661687 RepID=A0ABS3M196_9PROT|nr:hypothetical protein [Acetobacter sacchari]MBO1361928.1 hypothetical protein [Acetobacter sacchari]